MAKIKLEEQPEFLVFPEDSILVLKIDEVSVQDMQGSNGPWQKLNFTFKILECQAMGDGSPVANADSAIGSKIWGNVPFKLTDSPENKLRQWAEAIFGMELGVGFELDTDLFEGKTVRGVTNQYDKKANNPATGRPFRAHSVNSLLPYGSPLSAAAVQSKPDPWASEPTGYTNTPASTFTDEPPF